MATPVVLETVFKVSTEAIDKAFNNVEKSLASLDKKMKAVDFDQFGSSAQIAFAGLVVGAGLSVKALLDKEKVLNQTSIALRATGNASGMTAKELHALAEEIKNTQKVDDDLIISGQNLLLTFTNIGSKVFPAATKAMVDLSGKTGSMDSAATMLGKALNNPIEGLGALSRVGITFSESEKEVIKTMTESNRLADAQKVILDKLSVSFSGLANQAGTSQGKLFELEDVLGDILEGFGKVIWEGIQPFIDIAITLGKVVGENLDIIIPLVATFGTATTVIAGVTTVVWGLNSALLATIAASMKFLLTPWGAVLGLVSVAIGGIVYAMMNWEKVTNNVRLAWAHLKSLVSGDKSEVNAIKAEIQAKADALVEEEKILKAKAKLAEQGHSDELAKQLESDKLLLKQQELAKAKADKIAKAKEKQQADAQKATEEYVNKEMKWLDDMEKKYGQLEYAEIAFLKDKERRETKANQKKMKDQMRFEDKLYSNNKNITQDEIKWELDAEENKQSKKKEAQKKQYEFENGLGDARLEYAQQFTGNLMALQQTSSIELFRIGQAAAIANAVINISEGITKALSFGPIAGPILAATMAAAGAVQISQIASQEPQFAEGGIVTGPIRGLVGEAGPEAIIPLKPDGTGVPMLAAALKQAGGGASGGSKNVYNYNSTMRITLEDGTNFDSFKKKAEKWSKMNERKQRMKEKMKS